MKHILEEMDTKAELTLSSVTFNFSPMAAANAILLVFLERQDTKQSKASRNTLTP